MILCYIDSGALSEGHAEHCGVSCIVRMRTKPGRSRLVPLESGVSAINQAQSTGSGQQPAQFKTIQEEPEPWVAQLVERRVRSSLKLVQRGELTPRQALKQVISRLAERDLTDSQYCTLVAYFQAKKASQQLSPAKHLLLKVLLSAKNCQSQPVSVRDQQTTCRGVDTAETVNTIRATDQGFFSISQPALFDAQKQQQQVCIKAAATWSSNPLLIQQQQQLDV